ncbi:hypothetical protein SISSUDRAFT_1061592 [Sistotremastrum suecicum HHB10207 ss-3]|uniref:RING-type E3 ubiquitin transferase n=1 Tax=Sistotremastrum suecicum HHB10207 ss-3 TaxID=1314776 RepID=A0A166DTE4_9AGAM|nr:hypothetical protein SISSUDRAFT_1061592 [Sistotremastrum suecicum HHB10207 ss-3]
MQRHILLLLLLLQGYMGSPIIDDHVADSSSSESEVSWLLGWSLSWTGESTISIVDRKPPVSFDARPALFGPRMEEPIVGYVIPLSSFTKPCPKDSSETHRPIEDDRDPWRGVFSSSETNLGCPKLCQDGPHYPADSEIWFALVRRGSCSFVEKIREAQRLGANGVVVGGHDEDMIGMYSAGDASDVTIPSVYIARSSYNALSEMIENSNTSTSGLRTLSLQMNAEYPSWEWPILTFTLLLLLPSCLTLLTLFIHRVRVLRAQRRERAPEDYVNNLPWHVWGADGWEKWTTITPLQTPEAEARKSGDYTEIETGRPIDPDLENAGEGPSEPHGAPLPPWFLNQTECAICLSDFQKGDRVRVLPCNHIFHMEEIDEWLVQQKKVCPVCKADITNPHAPAPPNSHSPSQNPETNTSSEPDSQHNAPTERTPLLPGP